MRREGPWDAANLGEEHLSSGGAQAYGPKSPTLPILVQKIDGCFHGSGEQTGYWKAKSPPRELSTTGMDALWHQMRTQSCPSSCGRQLPKDQPGWQISADTSGMEADCWMTVGVENNISSKYPETRSDRTSPCHMPSSTEPITVVRGVLILICWGLSCRIHSQSWGCLNQALWTKVGKDRTLHKTGAFVRRRNKFIGRWTNVHERRYSKRSQQDCTYYVCLASLHSHFQAHMIPNQNGSKGFTPFHTLTLKDKMENNIHLPGLPRWEVTFLVKL